MGRQISTESSSESGDSSEGEPYEIRVAPRYHDMGWLGLAANFEQAE